MDLDDVIKLYTCGGIATAVAINRYVIRPIVSRSHPGYDYWSLQGEHYLSHFAIGLGVGVLAKYNMIPIMSGPIFSFGLGFLQDIIEAYNERGNVQLDQFAADTLGAATAILFI